MAPCGRLILRSAIWRSGYAQPVISDPTCLLQFNADIGTHRSDDVCFLLSADPCFRDRSLLRLGGNVTQVVPEFVADCIDNVGISS
jgi:hypothetical protein